MKLRLAIPMFMGAALLTVCAASYSPADFDRDQCYQRCKRTPGPMGQRSLHAHSPRLSQSSYDNCMLECDRQFWKDFDGRTNDPEKKTE